MARWTKNHMLELGWVLLVIGIVATAVSFLANSSMDPAWLAPYEKAVHRPQGDFNLVMLIVGPILLIWGGFWVGEQLVYRRRFERLLETPKKSEFAARRPQLEEISRRLPDGYKKRISAKENEFVSKRA